MDPYRTAVRRFKDTMKELESAISEVKISEQKLIKDKLDSYKQAQIAYGRAFYALAELWGMRPDAAEHMLGEIMQDVKASGDKNPESPKTAACRGRKYFEGKKE